MNWRRNWLQFVCMQKVTPKMTCPAPRHVCEQYQPHPPFNPVQLNIWRLLFNVDYSWSQRCKLLLHVGVHTVEYKRQVYQILVPFFLIIYYYDHDIFFCIYSSFGWIILPLNKVKKKKKIHFSSSIVEQINVSTIV